eukprot:TRINITY_DN2205_c0_g1_i2.p2 TRINITY_DN2205_c0_g1~~TRINITY_DN2205_c0_g1_i2.p2  ORF type:complete len:158 (+),score=75.95 TRINITY_DN2205_c0_g1_i2:33-476(+)
MGHDSDGLIDFNDYIQFLAKVYSVANVVENNQDVKEEEEEDEAAEETPARTITHASNTEQKHDENVHQLFSARELEMLQKKFRDADSNGDGMLGTDDIRSGVECVLGVQLTHQEALAYLEFADANKDGQVDWNEFVNLMRHLVLSTR